MTPSPIDDSSGASPDGLPPLREVIRAHGLDVVVVVNRYVAVERSDELERSAFFLVLAEESTQSPACHGG